MNYIESGNSPDRMAQTHEINMNPNELSLISKTSPRNATSINLQNSFLHKSQKSDLSSRVVAYYKQEIAKFKNEIKNYKQEISDLNTKIKKIEDESFKAKNEAEQRIKKYRKRGLKIQDKLEVIEKQHENATSQISFLEGLVKDYKVKVKKLSKSFGEAEKDNQELTEKIMDFIQREQDLMAANEQLMKKCRKMRSKSPKKRGQKSKSPKIKVWREKPNPKTPKEEEQPNPDRFNSKKDGQVNKTSKFSFSALFGRK
jgi:chromosome segregation ATPase